MQLNLAMRLLRQLTGRPNSAGGGQGQYGNTAMLPNIPMISRLYITFDYSYLKDH